MTLFPTQVNLCGRKHFVLNQDVLLDLGYFVCTFLVIRKGDGRSNLTRMFSLVTDLP